MPSVQPPSADRPHHPPQPLSVSKRELIEEIEIAAVNALLSTWKEAPSGGDDSKEGKIQQVVKELQEGRISIVQAALEIMQILQQAHKLNLSQVSAKNLNQPETHLDINLRLFAYYLSENPQIDSKYLDKTVELAQNFDDELIPLKEGAKQFSQLVAEFKETYPTSEYPKFPANILLK